MTKQKNFILVVSGVAGAGKGSVLSKLRDFPEEYGFSVSYTNRTPRPRDIPGVGYNFVSDAEFDEMAGRGEFLEWEAVHDNKYGTRQADFDTLLNSGKIPVLELDVKGLKSLKKKYKNIVSVFVTPPNLEVAKERLGKRATETDKQIALRISRYELEIAGSRDYDYTIINDDLGRAQSELLQIIEKEKKKYQARKKFTKYLLLPLLFLFLAGSAYASQKVDWMGLPYVDRLFPPTSSETENLVESPDLPAATVPAEVETQKIVAPPPKTVTNTIKKAPPKTAVDTNATPIEGTVANSDGSTTTTVSTSGGASSADLAKAAASAGVTVNSISDIPFTDQTGSHADLGQILKDYLSLTLSHRGETNYLKSITLEDAGATGWNGQYLGSYTIGPDGKDITTATGTIILNSYYYKNSPIFNDYMKLIFSHEYGHHYTLYHKWVDWDLSATTRLPDSYYTTRPLTKATTAVDYSAGWQNCESEIIAEDYSYLYSGYGVDAMAAIYGYPNSALRAWLDKIGSADLLSSNAVNNPPILTITSPVNSSTLSGTTNFSADAADDGGVQKVSFYINGNLLADDPTAPYATSLNTTGYPNGAYVLKAIASDGVLTAEQSVSVTIENQTSDTEKPILSLLAPATSPSTIYENNLLIHILATDNDKIAKIEMYYNDTLQGSWNVSDLSLRITLSAIGTYDLKFKAYDRAGNTVETILSVIRAEAPLTP